MFLAVAETICFEDPLCFSPAWPWLSTYTFLGGMETCIWDELMSSKTGKSTSVHTDNLPICEC